MTARAPAYVLFLAILPLRFDDPKHSGSLPPLPAPHAGAGEDPKDPHVQIRRLFVTVEKQLRQIDRLLADASSGDVSAAGQAEGKARESAAALAKLIDRSREQSQDVVAGIDRILELAGHGHPPGGT